jgi:hypothetical protein
MQHRQLLVEADGVILLGKTRDYCKENYRNFMSQY